MEELQNAIEDAQYVSAISTEAGLVPVAPWRIASDEEMEKWKLSKREASIDEGNENTHPKALSPEWSVSQPIGFFLFAHYVKTKRGDYDRLNFMEDVIKFKMSRSRHRCARSDKIISVYLSTTNGDEEKSAHQKKEIEAHDLGRIAPDLSKEEIKALVKESISEDAEVQKLAIGLNKNCALVRETIEKAQHVITNENGERKHKIPKKSVFDAIEVVVFETIKNQFWKDFEESIEYHRMLQFMWYQEQKVGEDDFRHIRDLGRGGFGLVSAVRKATSGKLFAMKVMNKRRIKMKKAERLAQNECMVLKAVNSPFVINLKYAFQSGDDVHLILDLMTGGDLSFHLYQKGFFPKEECLYYGARILLGLHALHEQGYVYRDLKPENCLLAEDGSMKLTDLGLACEITPTLHGAAGTRGYWAPEMLQRDENGKRLNYNQMVDWFSFGCVLGEFLSGESPFRTDEAINFGYDCGMKTKEKAIDHATLAWDPVFDPSKFDEDATDLCRKLLAKDATDRLGSNGYEEIMDHSFFKNVNWDLVMSDRKRPPFVPARDVNALTQKEIGQFEEGTEFKGTTLDEADALVYKDWDWTNPKAYAAEIIEYLIYERDLGHPLNPLVENKSCCCVLS